MVREWVLSVTPGDDIGHQLPVRCLSRDAVAGRLPDNDRGIGERRMTGEHRFDLPRFDAEAANLDLQVEPSQKIQIPGRHSPDPITRAVEAPAGMEGEGIRDEGRGSRHRPIQVATGDARAADAQLACHPRIDLLKPRIHDPGGDTGDRPADRSVSVRCRG